MTVTGQFSRVVVLVSGGGTNLQAIIDDVRQGELAVDLCGVMADKPDAYGLTRAANADIETVIVDYAAYADRDTAESALHDELTKMSPDIVVLAGFMRILPDRIVRDFEGRMLNVHPSLLPRYPGLDTYRRALSAGDEWHGSTVHFVTPELDAGPAIIQYRVRINAGETVESLSRRVQRGEYLIYPKAIGWLAEGRLAMRGDHATLDGRPLDEPVVIDEVS